MPPVISPGITSAIKNKTIKIILLGISSVFLMIFKEVTLDISTKISLGIASRPSLVIFSGIHAEIFLEIVVGNSSEIHAISAGIPPEIVPDIPLEHISAFLSWISQEIPSGIF